jgi:hypothetical protein
VKLTTLIPSTAQVRNAWIDTSNPPIFVHDVHTDKFDFIGHIPKIIFRHTQEYWWGPGGGVSGAVVPRGKVKGAAN